MTTIVGERSKDLALDAINGNELTAGEVVQVCQDYLRLLDGLEEIIKTYVTKEPAGD